VEYLCDEIALIDKGRIVEQGKPSQLLQQYMVENLEELFVKKVVSTR